MFYNEREENKMNDNEITTLAEEIRRELEGYAYDRIQNSVDSDDIDRLWDELNLRLQDVGLDG